MYIVSNQKDMSSRFPHNRMAYFQLKEAMRKNSYQKNKHMQ